ncbi:hypothetical protein ACFWVM_31295 [Nocardia fluminea]|uniref:hypothetical protein n=1 Tax=Nocardia fluminea TaxID=134984 RepID=UPI00364F4364
MPTNVVIPESAHAALAVIRAHHGFASRNKTVRWLLEDYVAEQRAREPDQRLMHVATLLRYPPTRRAAINSGCSPGRSLRVVVEAELWESAGELAFRIQGQSRFRGHPDYQSRPGTDAVLTAITRHELLDDPVLGTHQLLTHGQARNLWRLVVDSSRTGEEAAVVAQAGSARAIRESDASRRRVDLDGAKSHVERVAERLKDDVSWHAAARFGLAHAIVTDRLEGDDSAEFLCLLDAADPSADVRWQFEAERGAAHYKRLVRSGAMAHRGATAVWRAELADSSRELVGWLHDSRRASASRTRVMRPTKSTLVLPPDWVPTLFPSATPLPRLWQEHVRADRVLSLRYGGQQLLWPTCLTPDESTEPVAGVEVVVRTVRGQKGVAPGEVPLKVIETLLFDHGRIRVPAHIAHDVGLITADERDAIVAQAEHDDLEEQLAWLRPVMSDDLVFADLADRLSGESERRQSRIAYAWGYQSFVRYLAKIDHPWLATHWFDSDERNAKWAWQFSSLAAGLDQTCLTAVAVEWFTCTVLEMQRAVRKQDAFDRWKTASHYEDADAVVPARMR